LTVLPAASERTRASPLLALDSVELVRKTWQERTTTSGHLGRATHPDPLAHFPPAVFASRSPKFLVTTHACSPAIIGEMDDMRHANGDVSAVVATVDERLRDGAVRHAGEEAAWGANGSGGHKREASDSEQTRSGHTSPPSRPVRLLLGCDSDTASGRASRDHSSRSGMIGSGGETGSASGSGRRSRGGGSAGVPAESLGGATGSGGSGGTGSGGAGVLCSLSPLALPPPPPLLPYGDSHTLEEGAARLGGDASALRDVLQTPPRRLPTMGIGSPLDLGMADAGGMGGLAEMGGTPMVGDGEMGGLAAFGGMGSLGGLAELGALAGLGGMGASMGMALGLSGDMGLPKGFSPTYSIPAGGDGDDAADRGPGDADGELGLGALSVEAAMAMELMSDEPAGAFSSAAGGPAGAGGASKKRDGAAAKPPGSGVGVGGDAAAAADGAVDRESLVVGATASTARAGGGAKAAAARPKSGSPPLARRDAGVSKSTFPPRRGDGKPDSRKGPPPKAEYRCTFEGCSKTFARRYNRVVHSRKYVGRGGSSCKRGACLGSPLRPPRAVAMSTTLLHTCTNHRAVLMPTFATSK